MQWPERWKPGCQGASGTPLTGAGPNCVWCCSRSGTHGEVPLCPGSFPGQLRPRAGEESPAAPTSYWGSITKGTVSSAHALGVSARTSRAPSGPRAHSRGRHCARSPRSLAAGQPRFLCPPCGKGVSQEPLLPLPHAPRCLSLWWMERGPPELSSTWKWLRPSRCHCLASGWAPSLGTGRGPVLVGGGDDPEGSRRTADLQATSHAARGGEGSPQDPGAAALTRLDRNLGHRAVGEGSCDAE